jgi:uncharacterized damage-inducible protein DinB
VSPLQPEHATILRDALLRTLKSEQATTQRVIEAILPDKGDFRMDEVGKTALELAWHIVVAEHRFVGCAATGAFDVTPLPRPAHVDSPAAVSKWYAETAAEDQALVAAAPADVLTSSVDFRGVFRAPAVMFLQIGLNHSIHHRGQLSMYLRPMGSTVPAIYGESYDSAKAKAAAGA